MEESNRTSQEALQTAREAQKNQEDMEFTFYLAMFLGIVSIGGIGVFWYYSKKSKEKTRQEVY